MKRKLVPAKAVRSNLGDVSQMTLWRWLNNPELGFPRPIYINRRRYFDADEIENFKARAARQVLNTSSAGT